MSRSLQLSPGRRRRSLPRAAKNGNNSHHGYSSDPDTEPDAESDAAVDVTKMKTRFERGPAPPLPPRTPSATPRPPARPPKVRELVETGHTPDGRGVGLLGLGGVRSRLGKTLLGVAGGGAGDEADSQVSPSLRQLRMTPGRALQKQKLLERKHHEAKSRAHGLGVGGGVSLWPQMENMRLSRGEVVGLAAQSFLLVGAVTALFRYLHGSVLVGLKSFNQQLLQFPAVNKIDAASQDAFDKSLLAWHLAFTNLMDSILLEFDTQWPKALSTYHVVALLYVGCVMLLLYYLADNMFTTSRLTPQRIKIWVSLLVVTATWSALMVYFLGQAQTLEGRVAANVHHFSSQLSDLVFLDLSLERYHNVLLYWRTRCLPPTAAGTLSILGLLQVQDVAYYLQYYSLPVLTALLTPVVRLVLALKQVYSTTSRAH